MQQLVTLGSELIRINPSNGHIEYSTSGGRSWLTKNASSIARSLVALQDGGKEVIGMTADGHIYASSSEGATWLRRK